MYVCNGVLGIFLKVFQYQADRPSHCSVPKFRRKLQRKSWNLADFGRNSGGVFSYHGDVAEYNSGENVSGLVLWGLRSPEPGATTTRRHTLGSREDHLTHTHASRVKQQHWPFLAE